MRRRELIILMLGAAVTWPLAVSAQTAKVSTIGVLLTGNPDPETFLKDFRDASEWSVTRKGQNIRLEVRSAEGSSILLPQKAAELVDLKVDIIVAGADTRHSGGEASDQRNSHCDGTSRRTCGYWAYR